VSGDQFTYVDVAAALVLVALALLLSWRQRLDLERDLLIASLRAFVQLTAIGFVIALILDADRPIWVLLMLAAMLTFAAFTAARNVRVVPGALWLMVVALGLASVTTLGVMVLLGIVPTGARYVIPIGGMIIGNTMNVASVTALRIVQDAGTQRGRIEAALALGAEPRTAAHGIIRQAVRLAMVPIIDSTKTMGIVFLPGAMTGMILAGAPPLEAVRLQVVVMFMLIAATGLAATTVTWLMPSRLFTPQQQLRRLDT
jgi:putative ABC transport system permease protein